MRISITFFICGMLCLCLVSDAFIFMFLAVSTADTETTKNFTSLCCHNETTMTTKSCRCHCCKHIEKQEVSTFMISVFSTFVAVSFPEAFFRYFCSRLNEKWEFSSYLIRNCCCTVSERKLTSLWRLGHWTDCLSWEDRLVSSVSLFSCCLPTFQKTSACSGPETLLVAGGTSYIDHLVGCIASW